MFEVISGQGTLVRSAKGAECNKPGATPRSDGLLILEALKARNVLQAIAFRAFSASRNQQITSPGALPQAIAFRALGATN